MKFISCFRYLFVSVLTEYHELRHKYIIALYITYHSLRITYCNNVHVSDRTSNDGQLIITFFKVPGKSIAFYLATAAICHVRPVFDWIFLWLRKAYSILYIEVLLTVTV